MADSPVCTRSIFTLRHGPRQLVKILRLLGGIWCDAGPEREEVERVMQWFCVEVHQATGLSDRDLRAACHWLAADGRLANDENDCASLYFARHRSDLRYVAEPLHRLDLDGTTPKLWRRLWLHNPIIRKLCAELFPDEGADDAADDAEGQQPDSLPAGTSGEPAPPAAGPVTPPATGGGGEAEKLLAAVEAIDETAAAMLKLASDQSKSAGERMRLIIAYDQRAVGWTSPHWAAVLKVSDAAVRQTGLWKEMRKNHPRDC